MKQIFFFFILLFSIEAGAAVLKFVPQSFVQPNGTTVESIASADEYNHGVHDSLGSIIVQSPDKSVSNERFHEGTLYNLVVFIKFKDDPDFTQNRAFYDSLFNSKFSLNSYFREVSYNKLNIRSMLYPLNADLSKTIPYTDYHERSFYQPFNKTTNTNGYSDYSEQKTRLEGLLKNALEFVVKQVPDTLVVDKNNDGKIDNLCYIVRGKPDGWNDLIWPHRSSLSGSIVKVNGAKAYDYTFQVENTNVTTLCHEMFHLLGAPDLYHYTNDGLTPVGNWDLMETGFVHMGAYMKLRYADSTWIGSIPEINKSGRYSLKPLTSAVNNAYLFQNREIDSTSFFVVEYRKKQAGTFESNLPSSGLLVYRISPKLKGNADGPPDEIYIFRPNGTDKINGDISKAALSNTKGWTLGTKSAPLFYSDNKTSGIKIGDISEAGDSISFNIMLEKSNEANINSFFVLGMTSTAVINKSAGTIYCNVSSGTNLQRAKPIISLSELATISPASGSVIDLSNPYAYTVTAEDGTTRTWTVFANSTISNEANILSFELTNVEGEKVSINNETKTVTVVAPENTNLTGLSVIIVASEAATITPEPYFVTDFQLPVDFEVKAEDGSTAQWVVQISHLNGFNTIGLEKQFFELQKIGNETVLINRTGKGAQLIVYNLTGRLLYKMKMSEGENKLSFEKGQAYILVVSNNSYRKAFKMLKK